MGGPQKTKYILLTKTKRKIAKKKKPQTFGWEETIQRRLQIKHNKNKRVYILMCCPWYVCVCVYSFYLCRM